MRSERALPAGEDGSTTTDRPFLVLVMQSNLSRGAPARDAIPAGGIYLYRNNAKPSSGNLYVVPEDAQSS